MFLILLTEKQKTAFLALAGRLIESDARLCPEEQNLRELMNREMGFSRELVVQSREITEVLHEFDSRKAKVAVLLELLGLAYSDGDYGKEEKHLIEQIAAEFEISKEEVLAMENWALRQLALAYESTQFFSEKEGI
jgi:uncharacterized tellurite resistance protein B-like protein